MKLILIYGPPAAGKLTVAKELALQTRYKLFHNHLTIDLARDLYPEPGPKRFDLINQLRETVFGWAAKSDVNLIFTFVYGAKIDDDWVQKVNDIVENNGGELCGVHLTPSHETILGRVNQKSRQNSSKLTDVNELTKSLQQYEFYEPMKLSRNLTINNSNLSPNEVVQKIVSYYELGTVK